jgi:hypothetical protein
MRGQAGIEVCEKDGQLLALVVRRSFRAGSTQFVTPDSCTQQLGFIVYPAGTAIPRHSHLPLARSIVGTSEVLFVREGRCTAEIYDAQRSLVAEIELGAGDVIALNGGAHGFRVHENTVLMEVKQGPFTGLQEKERF